MDGAPAFRADFGALTLRTSRRAEARILLLDGCTGWSLYPSNRSGYRGKQEGACSPIHATVKLCHGGGTRFSFDHEVTW